LHAGTWHQVIDEILLTIQPKFRIKNLFSDERLQ